MSCDAHALEHERREAWLEEGEGLWGGMRNSDRPATTSAAKLLKQGTFIQMMRLLGSRTLRILVCSGLLALAATPSSAAEKRRALVVSPVNLASLSAPPTDAFGLDTHDTTAPGPCHLVWECNGVDLLAPRGTPVRAPFSGTVVLGINPFGGRSFRLRSSDGLMEAYGAHMSGFASTESRTVSPGDLLGYVGTSGNAGGGPPHLHFSLAAVRAGRWVAVDPFPALMALGAVPTSSSHLVTPSESGHRLVQVSNIHSRSGALRSGADSIEVAWTGPGDPLVTAELQLTARRQDGGTESGVLRANLAPNGQERLRLPEGLPPGWYAVRLTTLHNGTTLGSTLSAHRVLIASSGSIRGLEARVTVNTVHLRWRDFIGATHYRIRLWRRRHSTVTRTRHRRIDLPITKGRSYSISVTPMDDRGPLSQPCAPMRIRS